MKLKLLSAAALLAIVGQASAVTVVNLGAYTLTYDETTPGFTGLDGAFTGGGGLVGFDWKVEPVVQVNSFAGTVTSTFLLPDFTISVNPGYVLSGPLTAYLGQITYAEFGAATASMMAGGTVSVDGGPAFTVPPTPVTKVSTSATTGYFVDAAVAPLGAFSSFSFSAGSLALTATATPGSFAAIIGQDQNLLKFSFYAAPVPEPESYALLLSGLGLVAWMARRRRA